MELDGPALESLARAARKHLRSRMKALRSAVPASARARRDAELVGRLLALPEVANARAIALFCPMREKAEVDVGALDERARAEGRRVFYPRLASEPGATGEFALTASLGDLVSSGHGFLEPPRSAPPAGDGELDVIVVPALAVSATGHRLGYGSGYYDRVLPAWCPPALAVVVAYDFQLLAELPIRGGDVACDVIVTDARTLRRVE